MPGKRVNAMEENRPSSMRRFDITVAGELNLDLILYGLPAELPRDRELLASGLTLTLGSSSAIVAHNLATLGNRVGFISRVGDDQLGQIAIDRLAASGVDISEVRRVIASTKTGLTVILQRNGWRNILTYAGTIFELNFADLNFDYLASAHHFHLSSFYLQRGLRPQVPELFRKLKAAGLTISLDTNDDPDDGWEGGLRDALRYVDVLLPNEREARRIAHADNLDTAIASLAEMVPVVVVKLGERGATAQCGPERVVSPPVKVDVADAVGAGDSFDAGFLHQFLRGADLETCLANGNLAGALSTTRAGGTEAFRDPEHRKRFFETHKSAMT